MKFRRKSAATPAPEAEAKDDAARPTLDPTAGPFDSDQVAGDGVDRVDLGSLLIPALPGRELRLQVDEKSGTVRTVILTGEAGAVEFQAFAAPRNGDLWSTVRPQIAEDLTRRGGTSEEREGRWGTELQCQLKVQLPDGSVQSQTSRIVGINGSRWLLRASFIGAAAQDPEAFAEWEDTLAQVVVHRGSAAMPVGEALTIILPDDARRAG